MFYGYLQQIEALSLFSRQADYRTLEAKEIYQYGNLLILTWIFIYVHEYP